MGGREGKLERGGEAWRSGVGE
eukprot:SAG11_NODE_22321_length_408_cov_0.792880_1_plen_21_part_01